MLQTLEQVTQRLIQAYDPERIILFGSRALGTAHADSDYDILVVKETSEPRHLRRYEVHRLLGDRQIAIDLDVLTPAEIVSVTEMIVAIQKT